MLIDEYSRAYGVVVKSDYGYRKFKARKEIILSGGVFESPKLLKLSGIGPAYELKKWKVCNYFIKCLLVLGINEKQNGHYKVHYIIHSFFIRT